MLAHVRQDDTPEHDIRRPWAPTEREDGTRPILVPHPSDHALKTVPTRLDLLGGGLFGHGAVLASVDGIHRMGRLPLEIERRFPGERPGDEAGLPSTPETSGAGRFGRTRSDRRRWLWRVRDEATCEEREDPLVSGVEGRPASSP